MNERLLSRVEAAEYLNQLGGIRITGKALAKRAVLGTGPRYHRFGGRVLYRPSDLAAWFEENLSAPYSSTSAAGHESARQTAAATR